MRIPPGWKRLLRIGRPDIARDASDEVDFHLTMQIRDLIAEGLSPEEAEAEAVRRFGNPTRIRHRLMSADNQHHNEQRRSLAWADLRHDTRFALRQIARRPVFATVTVLILGLGIGANAAVFRVVDGALLRPLPLPNEAALVYATDLQNNEGGYPPSWPEFDDWRRDGAAIFDGLAAFAGNGYVVQYPEGPEQVIAGMIAGDFFRVLGVSPVAGRGFDPSEMQGETHVLMLSERIWRQRFAGDPGVVGRTLQIDQTAHTIIGIMPRAADVLVNRRELEFWKPMFLPERFRSRGFHLLRVMGRLRPELALEEARARAATFAEGLVQSGATTHRLELASVRQTLTGDSRPLLIALQGAVLFLLLIVCANLANLFLLQSAARGREFAIRTAIGAGRFRLIRQLLTESVLLGILGGALGLLLSRLAVGLVATVAQDAGALMPEATFDLRVMLFAGALGVITAIVFGLLPAMRAGGGDLGGTLRSGDPGRAGAARIQVLHRKLLVGAELSLSLVLLCGSALMIRSVLRLLREDPGFRPEGLLSFNVNLSGSRYPEARRAPFFEELLTRVTALPGVQSAAAASHLPLGGDDTNGGFTIPGREYPVGEGPYSKKRIASSGYFETMGIPLLRGRDFDDRDRADGRHVVLISELVARRYWPDQDPIGQEIDFGYGPGERQEIIGIVGDVRHDGLDIEIEGAIYRPLSQFPQPSMHIMVRAGVEPLGLAGSIREAVRVMDRLQPVRGFSTMETVIGRSIGTRRTLMVLLSIFAGIALVLAAVGVYTVTSQSVAQRQREIGVRMAIGADRQDVIRMVLREELRVIGLGIAAGLGGAWAATRLISASLYEVSARDPVTFGLVAGLLAGIGVAAIAVPALRASRVDPVVVLRGD